MQQSNVLPFAMPSESMLDAMYETQTCALDGISIKLGPTFTNMLAKNGLIASAIRRGSLNVARCTYHHFEQYYTCIYHLKNN